MKLFFLTFFSIFVAELGDKTQLATMGFAANNTADKWIVFAASAIALALSSFLGVFFGHYIAQYFTPKQIKLAAALLFIIIGLLTLHSALSAEPSKKYDRIIQFLKERQNTDCMGCENFQSTLRKIQKPEIAEGFIQEPLHPSKGCQNCNAEKLTKMLEE